MIGASGLLFGFAEVVLRSRNERNMTTISPTMLSNKLGTSIRAGLFLFERMMHHESNEKNRIMPAAK